MITLDQRRGGPQLATEGGLGRSRLLWTSNNHTDGRVGQNRCQEPPFDLLEWGLMEVFVFGNGFVEEDERGLKLQSPSCRMGRPDEEIVVVGEEIGADLIAMGGCGL